jgi:hypothetical protein
MIALSLIRGICFPREDGGEATSQPHSSLRPEGISGEWVDGRELRCVFIQ